MVKNPPAMRETRVQSLGGEDPLEKGMVTHSQYSCLENPKTEEPGRLQSMGCKESDTTEGVTLRADRALSQAFSCVICA